MKKTFLLFLVLLSAATFAQKFEAETLFNDKISIRALEIYDSKVWYAGNGSKFGYVNLTNPADQKQMILSEKKLEFRTLAQDNEAFYTINITSPAQFYKIDKKTLKSTIIQTDSTKNAFYDALHPHRGWFYTFSDPESDLALKFFAFKAKDVYKKKDFGTYQMKEGEAAFAASNTNIASSNRFVWLATGGNVSRIFRLNQRSGKIEIFNTPFVQGSSSQGIYSIDFYGNKFGIAVGGDYTKHQANINNIATTNDGGKTWTIQASGQNRGYKTCVKIRPGSRGKDILAIGDQNVEYSTDYGKTWRNVSEEKGLFVCEWLDRKNVVLAGKDKIVKMKLK